MLRVDSPRGTVSFASAINDRGHQRNPRPFVFVRSLPDAKISLLDSESTFCRALSFNILQLNTNGFYELLPDQVLFATILPKTLYQRLEVTVDSSDGDGAATRRRGTRGKEYVGKAG